MSYGILDDPVWTFEFPFPPASSYIAYTRYEIIAYRHPEPDPCPGEGKCHGCLCWCDWCGDVKDVCDAKWPGCCDTHERYPEAPEHLKPNPNQLWLPGIAV
jgi:hypothetical protein